jgi:long-chain acyl-CoA synthetase
MYAIISGGEPLPSNLREGFRQRFGKPILEGYGLTETSPVVTLNTPESNKPGAVGRAVPGATFKITDDNGNALPQGQSGEIWVKGPMVMKGYFNLPRETADVLTADGFFKTGDLGRFDEDGFLYITGRKKELIIVAGEKAVPREIEEALTKHPAVAEAAVLGKKDPSRGEVVAAFVVMREGQQVKPDELREVCRAHGLPQFKIPRDIIFVSEFPRSPTGKVLKRVLAEQLTQE